MLDVDWLKAELNEDLQGTKIGDDYLKGQFGMLSEMSRLCWANETKDRELGACRSQIRELEDDVDAGARAANERNNQILAHQQFWDRVDAALEYMHSKGWVPGNNLARNILVTRCDRPLIAGFGSSERLGRKTSLMED